VLAAAALAGGAQAQELEIEHAAARVVVIPEARGDVQVVITGGAANLPELEVRRRGSSVEIDGGLRNRVLSCNRDGRSGPAGTALQPANEMQVNIRGVGKVRAADLP
jgi:hypothetical protein